MWTLAGWQDTAASESSLRIRHQTGENQERCAKPTSPKDGVKAKEWS
jgi:hypothetical protein